MYGGGKDGFNTQPPKGGWVRVAAFPRQAVVSTHSRLKAAGEPTAEDLERRMCFNTQPPKGGWF